MTPSPSASAVASTGTTASTWLWLLLGLVLLVVFLFFRRRAAFEANLGQHRETWLGHAGRQAQEVRALAAEMSRAHTGADPALDQAALRRRGEKLAVKVDRLAAAAVTSDDAALAKRVGAALWGLIAAALESDPVAEVEVREAETELNAAVARLERPSGLPPEDT